VPGCGGERVALVQQGLSPSGIVVEERLAEEIEAPGGCARAAHAPGGGEGQLGLFDGRADLARVAEGEGLDDAVDAGLVAVAEPLRQLRGPPALLPGLVQLTGEEGDPSQGLKGQVAHRTARSGFGRFGGKTPSGGQVAPPPGAGRCRGQGQIGRASGRERV
jgi:hypothetical protein